MLSRYQRGDTIIEVMIAITIFSMVAVGAMAVMNQGMASAERSLEITLVRQQMDSQAEALRYFNSAYIANYAPDKTEKDYDLSTPAGQWYAIVHNKVEAAASTYGNCNEANGALKAPSTIADKPFVVNTSTGKVSGLTPSIADTYAQVRYNGLSDAQAAGLWIEAVRSVAQPDSKIPPYVDFHIRSCWSGPGQAAPITLGTIVRLYEPTN